MDYIVSASDQPCESLQASSCNTDTTPKSNDNTIIQDESDHFKPTTNDGREVELDSEASQDVLADGSLNYFVGVMQFSESEGYAKYKTRKHREKCKKSGEFIWSSKAEDLFLQMMLMIPPVFGKTKIDCKTISGIVESMGRNQLIGYLMERHNPPVKYTRKTISSHTQVVKKLLAADGNAAALARIRKDPRIVSARRSKDFYFDEMSMTLRAGEVRHNFSSVSTLSRFVPSLQLFNLPETSDNPIVYSVEFSMGVYQRDTLATDNSAKLIHSCTTLQTPGGAVTKHLSEIMPFVHLYPSLQDALNQDTECDILWFDSAINMLDQMPTTTCHVGIEFKTDVLSAKGYTDWKFKTNFYHHSGQPSYEIVRNPNVKLMADSKINIETSLFSPWWVKLFQSRILKRQEAGAELRRQLDVLQHGSCACKICLHLCTEIDKEVAAIDEHCRTYFQNMSIMQSIYARPEASQEHRCIAIFLFKFSQSSGNQVPLTTWHRVVWPDNIDVELISMPTSTLPTQPEALVGFEIPEWQPNFSDLVFGNSHISWLDEEQKADTHNASYGVDHNNLAEVGNLPCPMVSTALNRCYSEVSLQHSGSAANIVEHTKYTTSDPIEYPETISYQGPSSRRSKPTNSSVHEAFYHAYLEDQKYAQESANLQFQEPDIVSFDPSSFSIEVFNESDRSIPAHTEVLHFDFNQPLEIIVTKNDCNLKEELDDIVCYKIIEESKLDISASSSTDVTNDLLLSIPVYEQFSKSDHSNSKLATSSLEPIQAIQIGHSLSDDSHDIKQMAVDEQQHNDLFNKTVVCYGSANLHHHEHGLLSSIHDLPQDRTFEQGEHPQHTIPEFQTSQIRYSDAANQLSLLPSSYNHVTNFGGNTPESGSQDRQSDDLDFNSYDNRHCGIYRAPPTPPLSQGHSKAPTVLCQDETPRISQRSDGVSSEGDPIADLGTHHWIVELAIAKTEDMIEEACANYSNNHHEKSLQETADLEAIATLLESDHQSAEPECQEVSNYPLGKILGEVDTTDQGDKIKTEHHVDCDFTSSHFKNILEDKIVEFQNQSQKDKATPSICFANCGSVPQSPLDNEIRIDLNMECGESHQAEHDICLAKGATDQQMNGGIPSHMHGYQLLSNSQISPEDYHDVFVTRPVSTDPSTPEQNEQSIHYNSPQSPQPDPFQSVYEHRPSDLVGYNFGQHRTTCSDSHVIDQASILNEQRTPMSTPQSIEIEMSDAEDKDLTERIAVKIEKDLEQQSQESYHIISENGSFTSLERDNEWEKVEHEDAVMY